MSTFIVLKPGVQSWIVDQGRHGLEKEGISRSGAACLRDYDIVNRILDNQTSEPAIQVLLGGLRMELHEDCEMCFSGAPRKIFLDGSSIVMNKVIRAKSGDILEMSMGRTGKYTYVGIAGDWQVDKWKGSVSPMTALPDICSWSRLSKQSSYKIHVPNKKIGIRSLRTNDFSYHYAQLIVLPGPEYRRFSDREITLFTEQEWIISPDSNNIGARLMSEKTIGEKPRGIISSAIIEGAIQVNSFGMPMVLLNEAQTIGGYFRLGVLTSESLYQISQMLPGSKVKFKMVVKETDEP